MKTWRFSKFTDQQLAQLMGSLNDGSDSMRNRLLCEISYRLTRAGGGRLGNPEEIAQIEGIMNFQFRQREIERDRRRLHIVNSFRAWEKSGMRKPVASAEVVSIR